MKKIITMIGIASLLAVAPSCKKNDVKPLAEQSPASAMHTMHLDTASMYVLLDSKRCSTAESQYSSATVDIRRIKVLTEHGWDELTTVPGAWDVISLQQAPVPVADLTEKSTIHAGKITKIALTFGDNNKLVVNGAEARCYKIAEKEVVLDLNADIKAGTLNELIVSIDICGNISVHTAYDQDPCYVLNPVMAFHSISQK